MIRKWIDRIRGREHEAEGQPEDKKGKAVALEGSNSGDMARPQAPQSHQEQQPPGSTRKSLFRRLKEKMEKSRGGFVRRMDELLGGASAIDQELLDELEEILVTADMGVTTVERIFQEIREQVRRKELNDPALLRQRIKEKLCELLTVEAPPLAWRPAPFVVLMVGVNGVGKTTTIAKLAHSLKQEGKEILLVAADTFRAAAAEQLETWARRVGVPIVRHQAGADPSAVAFDGMESARRRGSDVVIVDTAGRLHTKVNLMEELKKIKRVIGKKVEGAPHETLLVLDATTGQNAVSQARMFHEATGVTGIVLTKLDGTAKGGIVVSIASELGIPIRYIGIGEQMDDLRPFDATQFVEALFGEG